jgi:hypothetical protein
MPWIASHALFVFVLNVATYWREEVPLSWMVEGIDAWFKGEAPTRLQDTITTATKPVLRLAEEQGRGFIGVTH